MDWCDKHPSVTRQNSEQIIIPYYSEFDQKWRRYFMDFIIQIEYPEGPRTFLVEVKPESQTYEPQRKPNQKTETYLKEMATWMVNRDKQTAATEYANKNGMEFKIFNEYDLGIKKRI